MRGGQTMHDAADSSWPISRASSLESDDGAGRAQSSNPRDGPPLTNSRTAPRLASRNCYMLMERRACTSTDQRRQMETEQNGTERN